MARKIRRDLLLTNCWLYSVSSKPDLARRLSTDKYPVTIDQLERLASDEGHFKEFPKTNRKGKVRQVQEPIRELQRIHERVHKLLSRIEVPAYLHSAVRGKSYLTNADAHSLTARTVKIDIKSFFKSVPRSAVKAFFRDSLQCRADVCGLMADLLTFNGHLPTGSCSSPIISYYAFKDMFDEIHALALENGLIMSCYVDDMTFSGDNATKSFLYKIHELIASHGLKSHKMKIFAENEPRVVTGVCLTPEGRKVPNQLHLDIKVGFDALVAGQGDLKKIKATLLGQLEAARQIEPKFGMRARTLRRSAIMADRQDTTPQETVASGK